MTLACFGLEKKNPSGYRQIMGCMCATLHPTVYKRHRQSLRIIHDGTKNQTDAAHQSCKSVAKHLLFFFPCPIELMGIVVLYMERLGRDLLAPWWPMFWLVTRALHRHMGYFFRPLDKSAKVAGCATWPVTPAGDCKLFKVVAWPMCVL